MQHVKYINNTRVESLASDLDIDSQTICGVHAVFESEYKARSSTLAVQKALDKLRVKTNLSIGVIWNNVVTPIYEDVTGESVSSEDRQVIHDFVLEGVDEQLPPNVEVSVLSQFEARQLVSDSRFDSETLAEYVNPAIILNGSQYLGTIRVVSDVTDAQSIKWPFENPNQTPLSAFVVSLDDCDIEFAPFPTETAWAVNPRADTPYPVSESLSVVADGILATAAMTPRDAFIPIQSDTEALSGSASVFQSGLRSSTVEAQHARSAPAEPVDEPRIAPEQEVAIISGPPSYVDELFIPHNAWAVQEKPDTDYVAIYESGQTAAITHIACVNELFTESEYLDAIGAENTDVSWAAASAADNERFVLKFSHTEELDTPVKCAGDPAVAGKLGQVTYTDVETVRDADAITDIPVFQPAKATN